MHSALGRFLDRPLDLAVGLVEPDGTQRVLPLTRHGEPLYAAEQFERINSITFRGHSETWGLKFEFNVHSPFYPQNEPLCIMPVFYIECRVTWAPRVRWRVKNYQPLEKVRLFIRLSRPETQIDVEGGRIDLSYDVPLSPRYGAAGGGAVEADQTDAAVAHVRERLISLNEGASASEGDDGSRGLTLELPVTEEGSGTKWRLVWVAHCGDEILQADGRMGRFRYVRHWPDIDAVTRDALEHRSDYLLHSRRFEKLLEQAPLGAAHEHLLHLGFQSYLSNTFWCDLEDGSEWFSNWEGTCKFHSTIDVEYNVSLFYFALWPRLLELTIDQWTRYGHGHEASGGTYLSHDMGSDLIADGQAYPHAMEVEENCNFLLMLDALVHWTGETVLLERHAELTRQLVAYLIWTDREGCGFPTEGTANTIDDASPAVQYAKRQTYLGVKRASALSSAAELLGRVGDDALAERCRQVADDAIDRIEKEAWLTEHYMVCTDRDTAGMVDVWTGRPLGMVPMPGAEGYSIYTANGMLLPVMVGRSAPLQSGRLNKDLINATRETLSRYGCGHTSGEESSVWISQNLWRDFAARYLQVNLPDLCGHYWDLEVFSNTGGQSFGFVDTYIENELAFYPRGAVAWGYFLAGPRISIDLLGGRRVTVNPDRHMAQRWPLLPLADWQAGRIPICVVDDDGSARIEGEINPVEILG